MKTLVPNYYKSFKCIADKCKHSCCKGWEIDVDEDTLKFYKSVKGNLGKRLSENIETDEENQAHFILFEDERCPFLNECGLCDIISELGENALCQICGDHPRFRNFYDDRTEMGLGICCEAAAEIMLSFEEKVNLVTLEDDGTDITRDDDFFAFREKIFEIVQDRSLTIEKRIEDMFSYVGVIYSPMSRDEQYEIYISLEKLDEGRDEILEKVKSLGENFPAEEIFSENEKAFEQLLYYFVMRHFTPFCDIYEAYEKLSFCADSVYMIASLWAVSIKEKGKALFEDLAEAARFYSSEVEYSEENLEMLIYEK